MNDLNIYNTYSTNDLIINNSKDHDVDDDDNDTSSSTDDGDNDINDIDNMDLQSSTLETNSKYLGLTFENEDSFRDWVTKEFNGYAVIHAKKKWRVGEHIGKHRDWTITCKYNKRCNCPLKMYIAWTLNTSGPCIRRVYNSHHEGHQIEIGSNGEMIRLEDIENKRISLQTMSLQVLQSNYTLQSLLRNSKKLLFNNYRFSSEAKKEVTNIFNAMKSAYLLSHPVSTNKSSNDKQITSNNVITNTTNLTYDHNVIDNSSSYLNLEFENEEKFRVWVCDEFQGFCIVQPKKKFEKGEHTGKFRDWVVVCRYKNRGCNFKMYVSWNKHSIGPKVKSSYVVHNNHVINDDIYETTYPIAANINHNLVHNSNDIDGNMSITNIPNSIHNDQMIKGEDILELRKEVEDLAKHSVEAGLSCAVLVKQCRKTLFKNFNITKGAEQTIRYLYRNVKNGRNLQTSNDTTALVSKHTNINASSKLAKVLYNQTANTQVVNDLSTGQSNVLDGNVTSNDVQLTVDDNQSNVYLYTQSSNGVSEALKKRKYEEYINIFDKAISSALNTLSLDIIQTQFNNFLTNLLNEQLYYPNHTNNTSTITNSYIDNDDSSVSVSDSPQKRMKL